MRNWLNFKNILILLLLLAVLGMGNLFYFLYKTGDNRGYAPKQPIAFSHKLHAGTNKIPCLYCHTNANKGPQATVPSMSTCMNCHLVVRTDAPAIQKLTEMYQKKEHLEWVKVYDMADHVFFNHRPHIAKGMTCETCHGDVKEMERVTQVYNINMGYCVSCHKNPREKLPDLKDLPEQASIQCSACHK